MQAALADTQGKLEAEAETANSLKAALADTQGKLEAESKASESLKAALAEAEAKSSLRAEPGHSKDSTDSTDKRFREVLVDAQRKLNAVLTNLEACASSLTR